MVDSRRRVAVHGGAQPRECDSNVVVAANPGAFCTAATSPKGSPSKAFEASRSSHRQMPGGGDVALSERSEFAQMPVLADGRLTGLPRALQGESFGERSGGARRTSARRRFAGHQVRDRRRSASLQQSWAKPLNKDRWY